MIVLGHFVFAVVNIRVASPIAADDVPAGDTFSAKPAVYG
jgi:hypothetical protein